jgi:predicted transcriptional regulator
VRDPIDPPAGVTLAIGPLERRVLDCLWAQPESTSVRELIDSFPGVAYTTLMTTADRLYRKGLLNRERDGRAFRYRPRWTRQELELRLARSAMARWLADSSRPLEPLISLFVDEVSRRDEAMLDELERRVRAKKESQR